MISRIFSIVLALSCISAFADNKIYGTWSGKLKVQGASLRLLFHISEPENDKSLPVITMDSPDQGVVGIPLQTNFCNEDSVSISAPKMNMTYTGHRKDNTISGVFSQMGMNLPLILHRGDNKPNRPQTPQPPFPYSTEEVKFKSIADTVTLAGTLTLPENVNPNTPVIVMVSGSGPQNRDEELFGHKPFAVLADRLARAGIASLRYDDRGVGESTGNPKYDITADFALDAEGAIRLLRESGYTNIGLLGHSEGGSIAFMSANSDFAPDFIVTLGAPGVIGKEILLDQILGKLAAINLQESEMDGIRQIIAYAFDTVINNPSATSTDLHVLIQQSMDENIPRFTSADSMARVVAETLKTDTSMFETPWMRGFLAYDPGNDISNTTKPTLALYGAKDTQVRPDINVPALKNYNDRITVKVYESLNHLMQPCTTGDSSEYGEIEITMDETVIQDIIDFTKSR